MKLTKEEFLSHSQKTITLIGMSGAGKTHISAQLESWGWYNYSCDFVIADKYLRNELPGSASLTVEDISVLSDYLGKLGNPNHGGFALDLFKERQKAYYDAEVQALYAMHDTMSTTDKSFVHDSTGSLCEIEDEGVLKKIGQQTLFVYLKTGLDEEREVLQRAQDYPKPLFFPPSFLEKAMQDYTAQHNLEIIEQAHPDDFARWVFPRLFEARKPKYQRLADLYGITIASSKFRNLSAADEFITIIADHLD